VGDDELERLWGDAARRLPWLRPPDRVLERDGRAVRWFPGGRLNLAHAALDAPVAAGRGGHPALVYRNERGERRAFTYAALLAEVERTAAALRAMGVGRGDRVTIAMPICPEAICLMLATTRIGAIHQVAFAGLGRTALAHRIRASGSRLVAGADVTYRKGKAIPLMGVLEAALADAGETVEACVVLQREPGTATLSPGRDLDWDDFLARATAATAGTSPPSRPTRPS
jgi:acyl-coenzyme A synthetase/AMP-(fatty) acid ligase